MIEQIEAAANQKFVELPLMPKEGNWTVLESIGIKRFEEVDEVFYRVEFPQGWRKVLSIEPGDHRGSYLVDNEGKKRVGIFYKCTPYDVTARFYIMD